MSNWLFRTETNEKLYQKLIKKIITKNGRCSDGLTACPYILEHYNSNECLIFSELLKHYKEEGELEDSYRCDECKKIFEELK